MGTGVNGSIFEAYVLEVRNEYGRDEFAPDIRDESWKIGRLKGQGQAAAPSIQFHRPSGTVQPTSRNGPFESTLDNGQPVYFASAYEDLATVQARIHAQSWQQLDCIWTGLLAAARNVLGIYSTPGSYDHVSEGDDNALPEFVKGNQLLVQSFEWTILIPQVFGSLTTIERILGTSQFINTNPAPGTPGPDTDQPLT